MGYLGGTLACMSQNQGVVEHVLLPLACWVGYMQKVDEVHILNYP